MKVYHFLLVVLLMAGVALPPSSPSAPQAGEEWVSTWPEGGIIYCAAIDPIRPSIIYAGSNGPGVFKSTNGGELWSAVNTGLPTTSYVGALAVSASAPDTVYAALSADENTGLYRSLNGGQSWTLITMASGPGMIAIDPSNNNRVYMALGAGEGGLLKTQDGWTTWMKVAPNLAEPRFMAVAIDPIHPNILYSGIYNLNTPMGVYKSLDYGMTWTRMNTGLGSLDVRGLAVDPNQPDTVLAGTGAGVYISRDAGQTWQEADPPTGKYTVVFSPTEPGVVFAGWLMLDKSTDHGEHWVSSGNGLNFDMINQIVVHPSIPGIVYVAGSRGMYKSTDGGGFWFPINAGLTGSTINALAISPQTPTTLYAGTWTTGLWKSTDGGESWVNINSSIQMISSLVVDPLNGSVVYIGQVNGSVYKSTDDGATWAQTPVHPLAVGAVNSMAIHPTQTNTLYAAVPPGSFKTTDGGYTWSQLTQGLPASYNFGTVAIDPTTPDTVYLGAFFENRLWRSLDAGATWTQTSGGLPVNKSGSISAIAIDPLQVDVMYAASNTQGVYKSTDNGSTWTTSNTGLTNLKVITLMVDPQTPTTLYAGTDGTGVFVSRSSGASWEPFTSLSSLAEAGQAPAIQTPLAAEVSSVKHLRLSALAAQNRRLFAGTSSGVWSMQQGSYNSFKLQNNPTHGQQGSAFKISASGLPLNSPVEVRVNGALLGTVNVDVAGRFNMQLLAQQAEPGFYMILLKNAGRHWSQLIHIDPTAPLLPTTPDIPEMILTGGQPGNLIYLPILLR